MPVWTGMKDPWMTLRLHMTHPLKEEEAVNWLHWAPNLKGQHHSSDKLLRQHLHLQNFFSGSAKEYWGDLWYQLSNSPCKTTSVVETWLHAQEIGVACSGYHPHPSLEIGKEWPWDNMYSAHQVYTGSMWRSASRYILWSKFCRYSFHLFFRSYFQLNLFSRYQ